MRVRGLDASELPIAQASVASTPPPRRPPRRGDRSSQRRLDEISHEAQADGQYGPAVRAEELLGKSIGMWVDQSVNISVSSEHVQALLNQARQRQLEPIDNSDDAETKSTSDDE